MPGKEVSYADAGKWAREVIANLFKFEIMGSSTTKKQQALAKVQEHRIALAEIFDIVCPGWTEPGDE